MTFFIIIFVVGLILLFANLAFIPRSLRQKQYGWVSIYIVVAAFIVWSLMSQWNKEYEVKLSELEAQQSVVRMVITLSTIDIITKERTTEVLMDNYEIPYVCSMMTAYNSYEDKQTDNWINVECLNIITDEQIPYMTKENLFPKGTEFDYDIDSIIDNFLHGQKT